MICLITNVLSYLEASAAKHGDKPAFVSPDASLTFAQLAKKSQSAGTYFAKYTHVRTPIAFFTDKSPLCAAGFLGAVYAGCFYVLIDPKHPVARQQAILKVLGAKLLVADSENLEKASSIGFDGEIISLEAACEETKDGDLLAEIRAQSTDADPLYTNFTSGSTGVPKGVLVSHRSVIDFISAFTEIFDITENDVIGNQAPFDFDVSVKDFYSGIFKGAAVYIIPRKYFSFPTMLMDYLVTNNVTVLTWAVSALCFVTTMRGLDYKIPHSVKKIIFSGEVMPVKHLNMWRKALPNALYANVYGPTEITCNCLYYILDREFQDDETLPLGKPFPNETVFLLGEKDKLVTKADTKGEICVAGTCLALGYYNDPARTTKSFVQNPLNTAYPQTIYRTGDLAFYTKNGEMFYAGRKDFQIKHMGHRVELGEIEHAAQNVKGVNRACYIYWEQKQRIIAFYDGTADKKVLAKALYELLPPFMLPNAVVQKKALPMTKNGKIDRAALLNSYIEEKGK